MMSLLSVTVKKARYVGAQASQFNTYVTLKLQNVKSTTVTVKGATPCWEQDFLFETNDLNTGLLIEVWSKGMIWDRAMGYHWLPLQTVQYSNEEGNGQWLSLEAELVMRDGEVVGTKSPTGHSLLVDCRFELPFDPENIEASDLQRKLEMLNNIMDQEARMEQAKRQMQYFGHSGYSEDSDYTSDLNYPVGQHPNSSASQFRTAAHQMRTPQRSLETSRENSYERDDAAPGGPHQHHLPMPPSTTHQHHLSPGTHRRPHQRYSPGNEDYNYTGSNPGHNTRQYQDNNSDFDPLFYNSRPRNKPDYSSQDTWASCETSFYNQSVDSMDGCSLDSQYFNSNQQFRSKARRPSLERQNTLYDDHAFYGDSIYYQNDNVTEVNCVDISSQQPFNQNQSLDEYYDSLSYPFQEERYGQDEEDRQWDSGGFAIPPPKINTKKLPSIPVVQNYMNKRRCSTTPLDDFYDEPYRSTPTTRRKMPAIPTKRSTSRQSSLNEGYRTPENCSHRGASLPPTPTKTPKILPKVAAQKAFNSLPPTPGRQLPKPNHRSAKARRNNLLKRTSSAEYNEVEDEYDVRTGAVSAKEMYNEDYNYAYQSIDNLPAQPEEMDVMMSGGFCDRPSDVVVSTMNAKNDKYYFSAQEDYYNDVPNGDKKKKLITRNGCSPLLQQNTDSLESRDDELKDSFDTAFSSMTSSLNKVKNIAVDVLNFTNTTPLASFTMNRPQQSTTTTTITSTATTVIVQPPPTTTQYPRDQILSPPKAIVTVGIQNQISSQTSNLPTSNSYKPPQTRGLLKQQDSVDLNQTPMVNSVDDEHDIYHDAYLEPQESVESYVEEDGDVDVVSIGVGLKNHNHDSPASVIHVDDYDDEEELVLRRGSSQITVVDPYHPGLDYATRRPSVNARRASGDNFNFNAEETYSRKPSIIERRVSPTTHQDDIPEERQHQEIVGDDDLPEKKSVSFEEDEDSKPRPQVTAKQRWLWAYNKIIMQLNVSEQPVAVLSTCGKF